MYTYLYRKEIMNHIGFLRPGRDIFGEFSYHNLQACLVNHHGYWYWVLLNLLALCDRSYRATAGHVHWCWQGTPRNPLWKVREFPAQGILAPSALFWNICKDSFSLTDPLNTYFSVEVEGNPTKHAPLDWWFDRDMPQMLFGRILFCFSRDVHRSSHAFDSEPLKWRCLHPWRYKYRYRAAAEVDALWEVLWWSHWAENPESRCVKRLGVAKGCSDTVWIRVACGTGSDCHLQTKRSWSCNTRRCPYAGALPGEHPSDCEVGFRKGLPRLPPTRQGYHSWFGDWDREQCLWRLHLFGKHHHSRFSDKNCALCLCSLHFFEKHHHSRLGDKYCGWCL